MCGDHAGLRRRRAVRLLRLDRAQERHRRSGAGKLLRPGARDLQRRPAPAGRALPARLSAHHRHRAHHRRQQPHARAGARRHPRAARLPTGWARSALNELVGKFGKDKILACFDRLLELSETQAARRRSPNGRTAASRPSASSTTTASISNKPVRIHVVVEKKGDRHPFRFQRLGRPDQRAGQYPPAAGAGRLRLCADLADRPAHVRVERAAARLHHRRRATAACSTRASRRRSTPTIRPSMRWSTPSSTR